MIAMVKLKFSVFGGCEIHDAQGAALPISTRKNKALLVYLAMTAEQPQLRGKLTALLWDRSAEEQARASLRQTLWSLRKILAAADADILHTDGDLIWLEPEALEIDAIRFERLLEQGDIDALQQAVSLYRGDFLAGFSLREESFEEWLMSERERLREQAMQALRQLQAHFETHGEAEAGLKISRQLLSLDPLQESAYRSMMRLYWRSGQRSSALRQYEACARLLRDELGIAPDPQTQALYQRILNNQPEPGELEEADAAHEPDSAQADVPPDITAAEAPDRPASILIVDDDPQIRELLTEYLSNNGYQVLEADSGKAMRQSLAEQEPDLVLLDVRLPGEDGLDLTRYLRGHHDVGIIMVTGAGEVVDRIVGLEMGADDYVAKPFDLRELLARIKSVLRRSRGQR